MDCEKIGKLLYRLRKEQSMTQKQVADIMNISDKAISKWERGQGCPDISLLPELAQIFEVSVEEILLGELNLKEMMEGGLNKLKFYVCPHCNSLVTATGDLTLLCCAEELEILEVKKAVGNHTLKIEDVEDELYVTTNHEMKKDHYISFVAYVIGDRAIIVKLYPEWNMQIRFQKQGHGRLYYYCTKDGLFCQRV